MDISVDDWNKIGLNAQTQTLNSRLRILQYNWVMRTYITPIRLNTFNPNIPDLCFKCGKLRGFSIYFLSNASKSCTMCIEYV